MFDQISQCLAVISAGRGDPAPTTIFFGKFSSDGLTFNTFWQADMALDDLSSFFLRPRVVTTLYGGKGAQKRNLALSVEQTSWGQFYSGFFVLFPIKQLKSSLMLVKCPLQYIKSCSQSKVSPIRHVLEVKFRFCNYFLTYRLPIFRKTAYP